MVLFIDEVDSLVGDTLISLLRQLRSGYDRRPSSFPQSIILCGLRDIRDYLSREYEQCYKYLLMELRLDPHNKSIINNLSI